MEIHQIVRARRQALGKEQVEVYRSANVDSGHYSRFENGTSGLGTKRLGRVLDALGLEIKPRDEAVA